MFLLLVTSYVINSELNHKQRTLVLYQLLTCKTTMMEENVCMYSAILNTILRTQELVEIQFCNDHLEMHDGFHELGNEGHKNIGFISCNLYLPYGI